MWQRSTAVGVRESGHFEALPRQGAAKYGMRYFEIIAAESTAEAGITKPIKPMTPAQTNREADRRAGIQKRIRDQTAATSRRISALRAKLAN